MKKFVILLESKVVKVNFNILMLGIRINRFLSYSPPTPPLSQNFALSEK